MVRTAVFWRLIISIRKHTEKSEKSKSRCVHGERADGKGHHPVIAPLSMTSDCKTLNVNADLAASAVAGALEADKLMFVTDVDGIMKEKQRLDVLTSEEIQTLIEQEVITGGMIPKVNSALSALSDQVSEVMIVNGKGSFFAEQTFQGTKIVKAKEAVS
ncbi:acetylglutamate kinase [Bacillus stercoris]|nr:acetylglutamate kinase [Bacillus stercoris]